jgi:hypothetical protein
MRKNNFNFETIFLMFFLVVQKILFSHAKVFFIHVKKVFSNANFIKELPNICPKFDLNQVKKLNCSVPVLQSIFSILFILPRPCIIA